MWRRTLLLMASGTCRVSSCCPKRGSTCRRVPLATGRVRYVGDQVAFVVANSQANAEEAAEQVMIDYDALPAVVDGYAALEDGAPQWDAHGTNLPFPERG